MTLELTPPLSDSRSVSMGFHGPISASAADHREPSHLALAWHNVAEASRRLDRLQERLAALAALPMDSSLT